MDSLVGEAGTKERLARVGQGNGLVRVELQLGERGPSDALPPLLFGLPREPERQALAADRDDLILREDGCLTVCHEWVVEDLDIPSRLGDVPESPDAELSDL